MKKKAVNISLSLYTINNIRSHHFTMSDPYAVELLRFVIPNYFDSHRSPFGKLFLPFRIRIWIIWFVCLFSAIIVILFTKLLTQRQRHFIIGGRMNRTPILNMIRLFLGGTISNPRMARNLQYFGTFARTLTMIWILSTFILRNAYEGQLFGHLRSPLMDSPYDTVQQILDSNFTVFTRSFNGKGDIPLSRIKLYKCDILDMLPHVLSGKDKGFIACPQTIIGYYNINRKNKSLAKASIDSLSILPIVMYFNNQSSLEEIFNHKISQIKESGLINFIFRSCMKFLNDKSTKLPNKISFETVSGAFYVWIGLLCMGSLVFALELISVRLPVVRKIIDFFTY